MNLRRLFSYRNILLIAGFVLLWGNVFAADLNFSLLLDKKEYAKDDPINMTFLVENTTSSSVMVNKRFYIGPESASSDKREVYLVLTAPKGEKLITKYDYSVGLPKSDYFVLLMPKEIVQSEYKRDLRAFFDVNEPGVYTVEAFYENVFGKEIGLDVFCGKLSSGPVTFKIIESKK